MSLWETRTECKTAAVGFFISQRHYSVVIVSLLCHYSVVCVFIGLDQKIKKSSQPEIKTRPSKKALESETRPGPLKSVLEIKTNLQYYNTSEGSVCPHLDCGPAAKCNFLLQHRSPGNTMALKVAHQPTSPPASQRVPISQREEMKLSERRTNEVYLNKKRPICLSGRASCTCIH